MLGRPERLALLASGWWRHVWRTCPPSVARSTWTRT